MSYQIKFKKIGNTKKFLIFKKKDSNSISLKKDYSFSEACDVYQNYVSTIDEDFDFEINLFNNIDSYSFDLRSKGNLGLDTLIIDDINTSLKNCDREEEMILMDLQRQLLEIIDGNSSNSFLDEEDENDLYDEYVEEDFKEDNDNDEEEYFNINNDEYENYIDIDDFEDSEMKSSQEEIKPVFPKEELILPFEEYISLDQEVIEKGKNLLEKYQNRFQHLDEYLQQKISFNDFDERLSEEKWLYLKAIADPLQFERIVNQVESEIDETTSHLTDQLERKYIECQMTESGIETAVQSKIEPLESKWSEESRGSVSKEIERVVQENEARLISFKEKQTEALNAFIAKQKEELETFSSRQKGQLNEQISEIKNNEKTRLEQKLISEAERIKEVHIKNAKSILLATKKKGFLRYNQALSDIQLKAKNLEQAYINELKVEVEKQTPIIQKKLDQLHEKEMVKEKLEIQNREMAIKEKELEIQKNKEEQTNESIAILVENKDKEIQQLKEEHQKEKEKELANRLQMLDKQMSYMERINQTVLNHSNIFVPKEEAELNEKKSESESDINKQESKDKLSFFSKNSKKINWKSTLLVCGAFLLGVIAMSVPVSIQGKSMETTVSQLEKKISSQKIGNSEKLAILQKELDKEKEEKEKLHEQIQQVNQENTYEGLIQKTNYIEAGKKYPEKIAEVENLLFEQEKLPELKAFNELMPSEFGTLDIAILEKNYVRVTEIYTVLLNKDISPKRKQGVALAYSQLGYYDMASWILR